MWKQAIGFASFGVVVALLGAALGRPTAGWTAYVSGSSFVGEFAGPWASQFTAAAVGGVVGFLSGAVLHVAGLRVVGSDGNRIVRVASAGTVGVAVGLSPTLFYVGSAFIGLPTNVSVAVSYETILVLYAVSAVLGYVCGIGAVGLALRACGDPFLARTVKALAVTLPAGGILATLAGVGLASLLGFSTTVPTLVAVVSTVVLILAATFALTRGRVRTNKPLT